jgi:hypothetical protein
MVESGLARSRCPGGQRHERAPNPPKGAPCDGVPDQASRRKSLGVEDGIPGPEAIRGRHRMGVLRALRSGAPPKRRSRGRMRETPPELSASRPPRGSPSRNPGATPSVESSQRRGPEGSCRRRDQLRSEADPERLRAEQLPTVRPEGSSREEKSSRNVRLRLDRLVHVNEGPCRLHRSSPGATAVWQSHRSDRSVALVERSRHRSIETSSTTEMKNSGSRARQMRCLHPAAADRWPNRWSAQGSPRGLAGGKAMNQCGRRRDGRERVEGMESVSRHP